MSAVYIVSSSSLGMEAGLVATLVVVSLCLVVLAGPMLCRASLVRLFWGVVLAVTLGSVVVEAVPYGGWTMQQCLAAGNNYWFCWILTGG